MAGLMGSIGRGLSAAGYAGADMYAKGALEDQRAAIQAERDARVAEMQEAAGIRAENRGLVNRAKERGAVVDEAVANAPRLRDVKAADATAEKATELNFYKDNQADILKRTRDTARAGHIDDGAGLRAVQIEAANMSLNEKKEVNKLMSEAETTQDPARKAAIMQSLTLRGVIKPGEHDTEKVTTEKMNDDGTTTKTERTQKRKAGLINSGASAPSEADIYAQAQAAIAGGAPADAVNKRLQELGHKPLEAKAETPKADKAAAAPARKVTYEEFQELASQSGYTRQQSGRGFSYAKPGRGQARDEMSSAALAQKLGVAL